MGLSRKLCRQDSGVHCRLVSDRKLTVLLLGNARLNGLESDLKMVESNFNFALTVYFM